MCNVDSSPLYSNDGRIQHIERILGERRSEIAASETSSVNITTANVAGGTVYRVYTNLSQPDGKTKVCFFEVTPEGVKGHLAHLESNGICVEDLSNPTAKDLDEVLRTVTPEHVPNDVELSQMMAGGLLREISGVAIMPDEHNN